MTHKKHTPPRIAAWIVSHLTLYNERHSINGDIEELYDEALNEKGRTTAILWYWMQALLSLFEYGRFTFCWSLVMIRNYLTITFRTLLKYKAFSLINIFGLAVSMAVCLMIIIFIRDWKNSDTFHEKKDRIARVYTTDANTGWDIDGWATTPGFLAQHLLDNYSFLDDAACLRQFGANVLKTETAFSISGLYAGQSFLNMFSFPLRNGDQETALQEPYSIIISEETALRFFGDDDPLNKVLTLEDLGDFTVTGVLRDLDVKSHFIFDALISIATVTSLENRDAIKYKMSDWSSFTRYYTYVLLKDEGDLSALREQLPAIASSLIPEQERERYRFRLQRLSDINLGINLMNSMPGTKPRLDIFFIPFLAILVMLLACFNYIILSIARALRRTKEIGLRKVIGARRSQVIKLFLSETFTVTFLALTAACLLLLVMIPAFNGIDAIENTKMQINIGLMKDPGLYTDFILFAIAVSLIAGLYPALYLSSFQPVRALQGSGKIKGFSHLLTRKILMTIQFAVSLISIIFIVYFYQLNAYWLAFDSGITIDNIASISMREIQHETFRNEALSNSSITGVCFSSSIPIYGGFNRPGLRTQAMEESRTAYYYSVDTEFIHTFGLKLVAGRNFSDDFPTDKNNTIIINEKAVQALNLGTPDDALGLELILGKNTNVTVVGVVQDFHYRSFENAIDPLALRFRPEEFRYANAAYVPGKKEAVTAALPGIWKKFDKVHPVNYVFLDDEKERMESQISGTINISAWACGLVVLIALFGLLGMAAYTTEMRVKEIGIRKVLGASAAGAAFVLSKDYIKLIVSAAVFALPCGYFLTDIFFQFFSVRPGLNPLVPFAVLVFILSLALVTIGSQTAKVARANPADTLRTE